MRKTRTTPILILILTLLLLTACGGGRASVKEVPMEDLAKTMLEADTSLPEMKTVDDTVNGPERYFSTVCELDYGKVKHFFIAWAAGGTADEICVVLTGSEADAKEAEEGFQKHIRKRQAMYETYDPAQAARFSNALTFTKGPYACFILSDDPDSVRAAFEEAVGE